MKTKTFYLLVIVFMIGSAACRKNNNEPENPEIGMDKLDIPAAFNWSTTKDVQFKITALDNIDQPIKGAKFFIYTKNPEENGRLIVSGLTNENGEYMIEYQVPSYYQNLYVTTDYIGLPNAREVAIGPTGFDVVFGGRQIAATMKTIMAPRATNSTFKFLGSYNNQGVPDYLEPEDDPITAEFLDDINATLPERVALPLSHPEFFSEVYDHNIRLVETCDVWVTFVSEGATYKNVLGFHTYPTGNPPQAVNDVDTITIIFPNASLSGSGGGLLPGNKVLLGRYNANTTIGFVLLADGWKNNEVTNGNWKIFSTKHLNRPSQPELKQHTVLLRDPGRELFLLGIEDIERSRSSCDHDFNDAIFYVTANPVQAVDPTGLPVLDYVGQDSDGDGVPDHFDDYPNDPEKAFNNFFFNEGNFGTLAFEDLWPYRGDYDFNDAVIDYNFNQITNGNNQVVELKATFILRAHGAFYENGFGFEMPIDPAMVSSVEGTRLTENIINLNNNGTEQGQPKATIIVWDNSYEILPPTSSSIGANTTPEVPFIVPDTLEIIVRLAEPTALNQLGIPPYNPFIFVNKNRGVEVHLPDKSPTALADESLLGTGHDSSDPSTGRYYKTANNLPWAINIIERFDYPIEKVEIIEAHLKFAEWAESGGEVFNDWYIDNSGYRNASNIYEPTER